MAKGERRARHTVQMSGPGLTVAGGRSHCDGSIGRGTVESRDKPNRGGSEFIVSVGHPR